jgi:hypothetical protein
MAGLVMPIAIPDEIRMRRDCIYCESLLLLFDIAMIGQHPGFGIREQVGTF